MIPKKPAPDLIRDGNRFSARSAPTKNLAPSVRGPRNQTGKISKNNSPAVLAATSRSDSGNSNRPATNNSRSIAAELPRQSRRRSWRRSRRRQLRRRRGRARRHDTAKRATDNGAGERILRRSVLRRQQRRKSQKYSSPRHPHHVPSPSICIRTFGSRRSRNDDAMLIWNHKVFAGENVTRLPASCRRSEFLFRPPQRPFALPRTTIDSTTLDGVFPRNCLTLGGLHLCGDLAAIDRSTQTRSGGFHFPWRRFAGISGSYLWLGRTA